MYRERLPPRLAPGTRSSDVRAALDAFRRIVQALRVGARAGERGAGLSSAQLFALQQIAEHPGASINDVAALTFTHQSSVSVVIQRLVAQRLVAKVAASHDRRQLNLELTAAGRRVLRRGPVIVQERLIAAISALPAAERRRFARALGDVARMVTPKDAAPHPPMLFEDGIRGGGRNTSSSRRHRE
jgi:MarR family transcriptional regulator, lower aerobic nicotinate degradation pathway regulator